MNGLKPVPFTEKKVKGPGAGSLKKSNRRSFDSPPPTSTPKSKCALWGPRKALGAPFAQDDNCFFAANLSDRALGFVLAEDYGGELEDVGVFVLPAIRVHACLDASLLKKCLPVPFLLHRDLREQIARSFGVTS